MMDCVRAMKTNCMEETLVSEFRMKVPFRVDPGHLHSAQGLSLVADVDIAEQKKILSNAAMTCVGSISYVLVILAVVLAPLAWGICPW